ncbi:GDP-4-dehydro-6-deoxy-D-mannose reductase [Metabacillus crassostreae]|uniref:NAD-dependent epimerase/dehydratase family protein n=1 Tax=Metabacillus crassostreae TaxID=929098 RepID=UPI001EF99508|nr:NAD-dependent epimerase/dehydratase family protein [Metabacillus crassostreae]MBM7603166.1 GDP-4-dehydro-6-deoxy-D-mannose reductase [Metabacillus crassostreae]
MKRDSKILITGASGFTGQHACNYFTELGYDVIGVTMNTPLVNKKVHTEFCDLTNKNNVSLLIKKVKPKYLLHLAGQNHVGESWNEPIKSLEANTMVTAHLLEAVRQENPTCKIVIVGSALQVDPANLSTLPHPYSLSKTLQIVIAQAWAKLYNMHIVIAKPCNLIGPGYSNGVCSLFAQKIVKMEKKMSNKILEVNNLLAQRDFLDVRDAVRAYEILLRRGRSGEIYSFASGKSRSLEEIIDVFKKMTTIDFEVITKVSPVYEKPIEINSSRITRLGWNQVIPFESSIKDIISFYRKILL